MLKKARHGKRGSHPTILPRWYGDTAAGKLASSMKRNSRPDEAPSSHVKLNDVYLVGLMDDSAVKLVATEENQVLLEFP